jgi:hypothetical protein
MISETFIHWTLSTAVSSLSLELDGSCAGGGPDIQKQPTQPPTHQCTFGTQNEVFCENIRFILMEIAKVASFGTRKSQVQILPPRPPSNKIGGTEYHGYDFWVGSWVGESRRPWLALQVKPDEFGPGVHSALV